MTILAIAWKDLNINFRDRNALILMIIAPLVMSAIIGAAFGSFLSGGTAPFDEIPVLVINDDEGEMGQQFVDALMSEDMADLLTITLMADLAAARALVQQGEARAAIYLPPDFTTAVQNTDPNAEQSLVHFYADPSATITPNIVRGIVVQLVNGFNGGAISAQVAVGQLLARSEIVGTALFNLEPVLNTTIEEVYGRDATAIELHEVAVGETVEAVEISPFAFFAPSMGILFLMFAMMDTTRSILEEEKGGTLSRLLTTPISRGTLLVGKVGGVFFSGIIQFVVFVAASRLLFQLYWGPSIAGLALMVLAIVTAYTGLGMLIAAFAQNINQAAILGSVISLVFAALGGNFVAAQNFPPWLNQLSKITINRWGIDGLIDLTIYGGGLPDVLAEAGVLLGLGVAFFALAMWQFNRRITH